MNPTKANVRAIHHRGARSYHTFDFHFHVYPVPSRDSLETVYKTDTLVLAMFVARLWLLLWLGQGIFIILGRRK